MSNYNLSDNVNESFEFEVSGHKYTMKYPLIDQIEELQNLVQENEGKDNTKVQDWLYAFITPVDPASPAIDELMKKQNVKVFANFSEMFKTEFGLQ